MRGAEEIFYSGFFVSSAATIIIIPKTDKTKKEIFKLVAPAIKPIIGGPINNPIIPIEETAAMATGAGKILNLPAALKTSGTAGETPMPTNNKPNVAGTKYGKNTAINKPDVVQIPHAIIIFVKPILCVSQSVIKRINAIDTINAVYPMPMKAFSATTTFLK